MRRKPPMQGLSTKSGLSNMYPEGHVREALWVNFTGVQASSECLVIEELSSLQYASNKSS